jgi:HD superfamily phosphohydrolase
MTETSRPKLFEVEATPKPAYDPPALDAQLSAFDALPDHEIFIPVWGLVRLTPLEAEVVDHPAFQRLREILQLGLTNLVFPGASHRRFEHALGTLYAVNLMMDSIDQNLNLLRAKNRDSVGQEAWSPDENIRPHERILTRLGALLHDIGHLANGHTFEDELGLLPPHDADARLNYVLDKTDWRDGTFESLRSLVDRLYSDVAHSAERDRTASELILDIISKDRQEVPATPGFRKGVCRDLIGNTFCSDLLDYLHRDWLHMGKLRFPDLRLLEYLEIRINTSTDLGNADPSQLVLNLRGGDRVRTDAVTAVLELLESRYQLAEIALFHRTKLSATAMLERVVAEVANTYENPATYTDGLVDHLMGCDDLELLSLLGSHVEESITGIAAGDKRFREDPLGVDLQLIGRLLVDLRVRKIHKLQVAVYSQGDAGLENRMRFFSGEPDSSAKGKQEPGPSSRGGKARRELAVALEEQFDLPSGSVAVYCPRSKMNAKVAEVRILIGGEVKTLASHEEDSNPNLTGGHLTAQKERFKRLWRLHVAVSEDANRQLKKRQQEKIFKETIVNYVCAIQDGEQAKMAREIAAAMIRTDPRFAVHRVRESQLVGAQGDPAAVVRMFPNRIPLILEYIEP